MNLLQKGDIIRLENGMKVYAEIPENVYIQNKPFSSKMTEQDIEIGKIYYRNEISKEQLINQLMKSINSIIIITKDKVTDLVETLNIDFTVKKFDTSIYASEYIVDWVTLKLGGWHVYCTKTEDPSMHVHFYQTGLFTASIHSIQPIDSNIPDWLKGRKDI